MHYLPPLRWPLVCQVERMHQAEAWLRVTNDRVEFLVDGLLDWCGCKVRSRYCRRFCGHFHGFGGHQVARRYHSNPLATKDIQNNDIRYTI